MLRTPFRAYVLQTIHNIAITELGSSLISSVVSTWIHPNEPDNAILLLSIEADAQKSDLRRVRKAILHTIAEESITWAEEEKKDYSQRIYFELMPVDV